MPATMDGLDYYAPHARVQLRRHVAIVGPPALDLSQIGRAVAGLCGVPLHDIARLIEHDVGASLRTLLKRGGPEEVRARAVRATRRALSDRPYGVIVVAHLELPRLLRWRLRLRTTLLLVERPLDETLRSIRQQRARAQERLPEFAGGGLFNAGKLRAAHAQRTREYARLAARVDAGDTPTLRVAQRIAARFGG